MATDWEKLRAEYVNGCMTFAELADTNGLKPATVRQRATREGWNDERHTLSRAVTQASQERMTTVRVDELAKSNEDNIKLVRAVRSQIAKHFTSAQGNAATIQPAELDVLMRAVERAQKVERLALGASTENNQLTGANGGPIEVKSVRDLTDEELKAELAKYGLQSPET